MAKEKKNKALDVCAGVYDPKLSEAGFMDLVSCITKRINSNSLKLEISTKPEAIQEAVNFLKIAAANYIIAIEGGADFVPLSSELPVWFLQGNGPDIPKPKQFNVGQK